MGRKILAVIVALITATCIIWIVEMVSTMAAATSPKNAEYMTRDDWAAYMGSMPATSYAIILIGYILASFAAGFVVTKMGRRWSPGPTLTVIVGVLLTVAGVANLFMLPGQPIWFMAASLVCYIPFSLLGYRFAR